MLEEQVQELIKEYNLKDKRAITFGHPKMKLKWILPLPGITISSFDSFQPFLIYFDKEGISFFPLNINDKYNIVGRSFASWKNIEKFIFKKGLLMEDEIQLELNDGKILMKIPKVKAMNEWVKENNAYLKENNYFYNK